MAPRSECTPWAGGGRRLSRRYSICLAGDSSLVKEQPARRSRVSAVESMARHRDLSHGGFFHKEIDSPQASRQPPRAQSGIQQEATEQTESLLRCLRYLLFKISSGSSALSVVNGVRDTFASPSFLLLRPRQRLLDPAI